MSHEASVLIVGAGPVGLTLAIELTRQGVPLRIVDKSATRSEYSKALIVWSRTLELFETGGLSQRLLAAGRPVLHTNIFIGNRRIVRLPLNAMDSQYSFALMLPQAETERLLDERLRENGIRVERSTELVAFDQDAAGTTVHLRHADGDMEITRVGWLLACDGAHSTVRRQLKLPFSGDTEPSDWINADVRLSGPGLVPGEMSFYWTDEGVLGVFPIVGDRFRVIADMGPARGSGRRDDPTLPEVQRLLHTRGPAGVTATDPVWLSTFRINARKVQGYRHGRVLLVGDAAHIHSPAGGQGMNTGMQDAINLAWKLALVTRGAADDALLESYSTERSAIGRRVMEEAGRLTRLAIARDPLRQILRRLGLSLLGSSERLMHRMARRFGELDIAYPESPLSRTQPGAPRGRHVLAAGDRCSDLQLTNRGDGSSQSLLTLAAGPGLTLLAVSGQRPFEEAEIDTVRRRLNARFGDLIRLVAVQTTPAPRSTDLNMWSATAGTDAYGGDAGGLFVLRPDRYVGLVARHSDWSAVDDYIAAIGGKSPAKNRTLRHHAGIPSPSAA